MSEATRGHKTSEEHVQQMWVDFKSTASERAREGLILHYSPLVKFVAGRVGVGLPRSVEQSDLISYGIFGLIDAIDKFDLERGFKFETYAINRVKGAILDELRALDWVPRSVRARAREIERSLQELEHKLQRTPSEEELSDKMEMPLSHLQDTLGEISSLGLVALDELLGRDSDSSSVGDVLPDPRGMTPEAAFQIEETKRVVADAINRLPDRERLVVTLYYYEGLTLAEIGEVLGVTESRVCQIHTKAVMSLRNRMAVTN